ncbi:MAG: HAMP domain-containing histidine kinase [Bacilli bacterium]|nr:HAMP domain-containing histidine kinase [Bacilli bacterium]
MKELNKKVFRTIFLILSVFIVLVIVVYNINIYSKEYNGVHRHLTFMDRDRFKPDDKGMEPKDRNIDNMMIMDYEVYTVIINNNEIDRIISHNDNDSDFDIDKVSKSIISKDKGLKIGNLYISKYSYNYTNDRLVIINNKDINNKLLVTLIESIIVLLVVEIIIYYVSRMLTKRITRPAEEAFSKQKDFIADASHELKTPLAVIMASADEIKIDKKNSKYIDNIKYESERMNNLIKSLLDLSKLENGVSIDSYKDENISKIIEKVCLIFEGVAFEESIKIDTNIEEDIILKCNKDEIERLISIIIDNAIKHSYKDSTIDVNVNKDKNIINIEIINKGEPIKSGDEEKIFERFYRADKSRNRDVNRYGLGLAIAKNIVINHNGSIKAYSKDGKTTFKIILKK